jgi:acetyl esterase/lipase
MRQNLHLVAAASILLFACALMPAGASLAIQTPVPPTATEAAPPTHTPVSPQGSFNPADLGGVERNVTYCSPGGVGLNMDLYFPAQTGNPWPTVVFVHGGGWTQGNKSGGVGLETHGALNAAGFLVASVDYRLAPAYKFPAMIEDVKCAVRYLRAHAGEYNLDPQRIGAIGGSAGGHLVSLLGLAGPSAGWDVGEYLNESSAVQAVVDFFGPEDLTDASFNSPLAQNLDVTVFGASSRQDPILTEASPVTYIQNGDPPFLIVQGDQDTTVPPAQSRILYQRLTSAGNMATLIIVKNAGHSFVPVGGPISPTLPQIDALAVHFFLMVLK